MSKIKTLVALAVLGATTFPIAGGALVRPAQARPRNNGGLGSIIIGGAIGYGIYAANKHNRQDNYYRNNGSYGYGRNNRREPEHHEGYGQTHNNGYGNNGYGYGGNGGYGGYNNGGYNNGGYNNGGYNNGGYNNCGYNNGYGGYSGGGYGYGGNNNGYGAGNSHHDDYDHHRR